VRGADNLTTIMSPNVVKIWESKPLGTLWASPDLLRDDFTFT